MRNELKALLDIPPWEWPPIAGEMFRQALTDPQASKSDRLVAAELAGDLVVMNDGLAAALLKVLGSPDETDETRARAAISLGPVLEQAYTFEFDDPDDVPITETTFHNIQDRLQKLYSDPAIPKLVRRRILEASVRAPQPWHNAAIEQAYSSGDRDWMLTAVFGMRWVSGFDGRILSALQSKDPDIHYEAVEAAGRHELDGAWSHVVKLVEDPKTPKSLLIAAIGAVGAIRPAEAGRKLVDLADSEDEDIAEAVDEAMSMGEVMSDDDEDEDDDDEERLD